MEHLIADNALDGALYGMSMLRWSRRIWGAIHGLAFLYPSQCLADLMYALAKFLPCSMCSHHVHEYMTSHPFSSTDTVPYYWFEYTRGLHNAVNEQNNARTYTSEELLTDYTRVQSNDPTYFQESVHERVWQAVWTMVCTFDIMRFYKDVEETQWEILHRLILRVQTITTVHAHLPEMSVDTLPKSCVVAWVHAVCQEQPTPGPLDWWRKRLRNSHQIYRGVVISEFDPALLLCEEMFGSGVSKVLDSPFNRSDAIFLFKTSQNRTLLYNTMSALDQASSQASEHIATPHTTSTKTAEDIEQSPGEQECPVIPHSGTTEGVVVIGIIVGCTLVIALPIILFAYYRQIKTVSSTVRKTLEDLRRP